MPFGFSSVLRGLAFGVAIAGQSLGNRWANVALAGLRLFHARPFVTDFAT
jgi:hypothetical protein